MGEMIACTGHRKAMLKSDGGSQITALKGAVAAPSTCGVGVEVSPGGGAAANGEVERAVRAVRWAQTTISS